MRFEKSQNLENQQNFNKMVLNNPNASQQELHALKQSLEQTLAKIEMDERNGVDGLGDFKNQCHSDLRLVKQRLR